MINQIGIMVFGVLAVYLVGRTDRAKKYGYIIGLCGQPFWFIEAIHTQQWGIFIISLFYTYSWGTGVYNNWIKHKS